MNPILKNILAVILAWICGSAVNMGLIMIGDAVIGSPDGVDPSNMESIKENMHLFSPKHFIVPFIAHALGTLVGAFVVAKVAANNKMKFAIGIGVLFLIGGIIMAVSVGGPWWFLILDLGLAYIPMALIGGRMALGRPALRPMDD